MARAPQRWLVLGVVAVTVIAGQPAAAGGDLAALLPSEAAGYRAEAGDELFDRDTLFDLIDGSAEVYRALNVRAVISRRYVKQDAADIMVDLFDMGSDSDAYGAYHHDMRDGKPAGVGHESEREAGSLFFWKGHYFVSIVALEDDARTRKAARALGKAIAAAIPTQGKVPALVGLLPRKGLIASQLHYFHGWQLLSRHCRLGASNPLGLGDDTEGIVARYRRASGGTTARPALVLVRYPSAKAAAAAHAGFVAEHATDTGDAAVAARVHDDLLMIVLDAADEAAALALIGEVRIPRGKQP